MPITRGLGAFAVVITPDGREPVDTEPTQVPPAPVHDDPSPALAELIVEHPELWPKS